ncbi:MAG: SIMPL domain-containing protein [Acidimicrobiales bacterium]
MTVSQPVDPPVTDIVVRGTAEGRVMPDRATIGVTVSADAPSRDEAYAAAAPTAQAVDSVLAGHAAHTDRVVTAALTVQPTTRWRKGEQQRTGWRAARHTRVELTAEADVGQLVAELARAGAAVAGPTWTVDVDNEAHADVRRSAAADARARAEAYAEGLGLGLGRVLWLAEPGLGRRSGTAGAPPGPVRAGVALMGAAPAGADDEIIDATPGEVTLSASVEAAFELIYLAH